MTSSKQLAKHFTDVFFGGNWTVSNVKNLLQDVTLAQATEKVGDCNTIYVLTYHIHYYVATVRKVLEGKPLQAKDSYSFDAPTLTSETEWQAYLTQIWEDVNVFSELVARLSDESLYTDFTDSKYGSYYRNILGIIEHTHYHLGQIAILKKLITASNDS